MSLLEPLAGDLEQRKFATLSRNNTKYSDLRYLLLPPTFTSTSFSNLVKDRGETAWTRTWPIPYHMAHVSQ
jgi:hypothetical protein